MNKKLLIYFTALLLVTTTSFGQNEPFTMRVVNPGYQLNSAWEVTYGPDDSLWVTENKSYIVSRINIANGGKSDLIDLSSKKNFTNPPKWPQGGLMGMALHPTLYSEWPIASKPFIYLAYVYQYNSTTGCSNGTGACNFNTRIVRYTYNRVTHSLSNEKIIIERLNGSNDHNSGRLTIGKVGTTSYLFYTIGDMGAGQFNNVSRTNRAQTRDSLEGKVLRFNLEEDADAGMEDKWVPDDNPFTDNNSKITPVWSWGHRNAQGIVMGSNGVLYSSEQQDMSDDEINTIDKNRNYGWPKVCGYGDGNYDGKKLANVIVTDEAANQTALNSKDPVYTFYTTLRVDTITTDNKKWPTIACSSIDIYERNAIPGWKNSLLIPSLKAGLIYRLKLDPTGTFVTDSSTVPIMRNKGRYRDICISPDGMKIYVACDISGQTSGPTGSYNGGGTPPANAGRILEFTYTGSVLSINDTLNKYVRNTTLEIYPNPASKIIYVKSVKATTKPLHYFIYDITGKVVLNGKSNNDQFSVNVESLTSGVYVFKLYNAYNKNISTEKVIIQ